MNDVFVILCLAFLIAGYVIGYAARGIDDKYR